MGNEHSVSLSGGETHAVEPTDEEVKTVEASILDARRKCVNHAREELLPIMRVMFNIRECSKNMVLLEEHLVESRKRCKDCIRKHFALIEALAAEGCTLDPTGRYYTLCDSLAELFRQLLADTFKGSRSPNDIASTIRAVRKPLLKWSTEWIVEHSYVPDPQPQN